MWTSASKLLGATDAADVGVSVNGTWQRKCFTSLNGVMKSMSIDSGNILVTAILSKICKGCTKMQAIKAIDPLLYDKWNAAHKCGLNYKDSSPAMETVGAEKIFKQSLTKNNLHYSPLYNDDDDSNQGMSKCIFYLIYKKTIFFCLSLNFLNIMLETMFEFAITVSIF